MEYLELNAFSFVFISACICKYNSSNLLKSVDREGTSISCFTYSIMSTKCSLSTSKKGLSVLTIHFNSFPINTSTSKVRFILRLSKNPRTGFAESFLAKSSGHSFGCFSRRCVKMMYLKVLEISFYNTCNGNGQLPDLCVCPS